MRCLCGASPGPSTVKSGALAATSNGRVSWQQTGPRHLDPCAPTVREASRQPPAASVISRSFESTGEPLCASRTAAVARSLNLHCAVASRACIVLCTYLGRAAAAGERRESVWTAHVATGCGPHRSGSCLPASGALACTDRTAPSLVAFALQELVCPTACGLALLGVARILFNVARPLPNLSSPIKSTTETTFTPSTHLSPTFRARSFPPHPPRQ